MQDDEVKDEIAELVDARLRDIVSERVAKFSEDDLLSLIDKAINRRKMAMQINPTFNVPKGEPPVAQFSMPPMEPRINIVNPDNADVLVSISSALDRIMLHLNELKAPKRVVVERDAQGFIKSCTIERIGR